MMFVLSDGSEDYFVRHGQVGGPCEVTSQLGEATPFVASVEDGTWTIRQVGARVGGCTTPQRAEMPPGCWTPIPVKLELV